MTVLKSKLHHISVLYYFNLLVQCLCNSVNILTALDEQQLTNIYHMLFPFRRRLLIMLIVMLFSTCCPNIFIMLFHITHII